MRIKSSRQFNLSNNRNILMISAADIMHELTKTLGPSAPEVTRVCSAIVAYLARQPADRHLHLTYSVLKREARANTDSDLIAAIQYLTGAKADLLEMEFEFLDEEGEYYPVVKSALVKAEREKALEHPLTGEMIRDYKSSLLVYYTPTAHARSSLCLQAKSD